MDDLFKKLYDYIELFDADWKNRLKPASKRSITQFIKTSRIGEYACRIPESYFQFLERMGQDDGGLISNLKGGGTINPEDLKNGIKKHYFLTFSNYERDYLARKKFPFFMDWIGGAPIYFDLSTEDNKGIWKGFDDNIERISESFEKLLFQCAFDWFVEYEFKKNYTRSINGKEEYQRIIQVVEGYGVKETWFSDPNEYRGEGENIAFSMKYYDKNSICGKITSKDERGRCISEELLLY